MSDLIISHMLGEDLPKSSISKFIKSHALVGLEPGHEMGCIIARIALSIGRDDEDCKLLFGDVVD